MSWYHDQLYRHTPLPLPNLIHDLIADLVRVPNGRRREAHRGQLSAVQHGGPPHAVLRGRAREEDAACDGGGGGTGGGGELVRGTQGSAACSAPATGGERAAAVRHCRRCAGQWRGCRRTRGGQWQQRRQRQSPSPAPSAERQQQQGARFSGGPCFAPLVWWRCSSPLVVLCVIVVVTWRQWQWSCTQRFFVLPCHAVVHVTRNNQWRRWRWPC